LPGKISRRTLLAAGLGAAGTALLPRRKILAADSANVPSATIDRQALVRRFNPSVSRLDPFSALSVGNGNFAFTADITGLQTFWDEYRSQFPLCTCAHWAWHTAPGADTRPQDLKLHQYQSHGRLVGYPTDAKGQESLFNWLRENPHRMHLGRIGLLLKKPDGSLAVPGDISRIAQTLDLWTGILESRFEFAGVAVLVRTCCHPDTDALAVRIESSSVRDGRLAVRIAFAYPTPQVEMADWNSPQRHQTNCSIAAGRADLQRRIDEDRYFVRISWPAGRFEQTGAHEFQLLSPGSDSLELTASFSLSAMPDGPPPVASTFAESAQSWEKFWSGGGAVDLSASSDPRAAELQRRIVLSQFNTALHCAAPMPPPETGLLFNSWYGKSHLEMHWWHGVHFAAWNRFALLEKSLGFYQRILPVARQIAQQQGYDGVRWPKMVGPDGRNSPSPVAPLLIWQQPHPIYFAELCYQRDPSPRVLEQWRDIVLQSAAFMASYAALDGGRYVLGPPLKTVSENTDALTTMNPLFELTYWRFGLSVAQQWRKRLGMAPDPTWADILNRLSPLPRQDDLYLMNEGMTDTFTRWNWEHPALLGAFGMQPGEPVDPPTMRRTLKRVMETWQWDRCWGWDFPMAAMTAAKLGEPELAVNALLIDSVKNHYLPNGHVYQRPDLTTYLPANGGLLAAVAMMALHGAFPRDRWSVRFEQLKPLL
jgi:hypothetical protein